VLAIDVPATDAIAGSPADFVGSNMLFGPIPVSQVDLDRAGKPREDTENPEYSHRDDGCHEREAPK
jgi:hypothetical protein